MQGSESSSDPESAHYDFNKPIEISDYIQKRFLRVSLLTQRRGTSDADIIQQIRTSSGELLTTTIGHDNKEKDDIGKSALNTPYLENMFC